MGAGEQSPVWVWRMKGVRDEGRPSPRVWSAHITLYSHWSPMAPAALSNHTYKRPQERCGREATGMETFQHFRCRTPGDANVPGLSFENWSSSHRPHSGYSEDRLWSCTSLKCTKHSTNLPVHRWEENVNGKAVSGFWRHGLFSYCISGSFRWETMQRSKLWCRQTVGSGNDLNFFGHWPLRTPTSPTKPQSDNIQSLKEKDRRNFPNLENSVEEPSYPRSLAGPFTWIHVSMTLLE